MGGSDKPSVQDDVRVEDTSGNRLAPAQAMSEEEFALAEKKLKRKLDLHLLACSWLIFVMNYIDRKNIAAAKVAGLAKDLNLTDTQYSTAVAMLFIGYILFQTPSNIWLTGMRPSLYLPGCMAVWGLLSTLTAVVHSAAALYAVRLFLGIVESAFYPGALFLISSWYKRSEMSFRTALLYSATQVGAAFSGLIAAGIQYGMDGARGLESWRWLFIIEGTVTIAIALASIWILPDWPSTTRWLSPTERAVAEWRLIKDAGQVDEDDEKWSYGFKMAFKDWRMYVFGMILMCLQVASAVSNFFPTVVQTLGFGRVQTLLLSVPPYIITIFVSAANNWDADRTKNASFHITGPMLCAITGFIVAAASENTGARYFAMILMTIGGGAANAVVTAWTQKTMLRPRIKRAAAVAYVNGFGNIAQVWTSYMWKDEDAPRYVNVMIVNAAFALMTIILAMFMRIVLQRANKKLEAGGDVNEIMKGEAQTVIQGLTKEEQEQAKASFRYVT